MWSYGLILYVICSFTPGSLADCSADDSSFQCLDGVCLPAAHHCDGYDHCGDEYDEDPQLCRGRQSQFVCKNGVSIAASARCNGYENCRDGSDEDPVECEVNTLLVSAGEVVTARVQHNVSRGWIYFTLCDDSACSSIDVYGTTPRGGLKYKTWTTCSRLGAYGCHWNNWNRPPGTTPLPTGEHVFLLERRPSELALWLEGRPNQVMTVQTKPGYDRLRIRYFRWERATPPVKYTGGKLWQPFDNSDNEAQSCGTARFFGPLVSGTRAQPEYFPWHGALYKEGPEGKHTYLCGASLLSASTLVTAAHCVESNAYKYAVAIGMLSSDWNRDYAGVHKSRVAHVIIHPDYYGSRGKWDADLALLHLEKPVKLSRNISPLCLPSNSTWLVPEDIITVPGWGNGSTALEELHFAELPYLPRRQCLTATSSSLPAAVTFLTNDKFCSVRSRGVILKGDSGGGAVAHRLGVWYLAGVVSSGIDQSRIVTFTNVTFGDYASWIEESMDVPRRSEGLATPLSMPAESDSDSATKSPLRDSDSLTRETHSDSVTRSRHTDSDLESTTRATPADSDSPTRAPVTDSDSPTKAPVTYSDSDSPTRAPLTHSDSHSPTRALQVESDLDSLIRARHTESVSSSTIRAPLTDSDSHTRAPNLKSFSDSLARAPLTASLSAER